MFIKLFFWFSRLWKHFHISSQTDTFLFKIPCSHFGRCMRETRLIGDFGAACNSSFDVCDARLSRHRYVLCWPFCPDMQYKFYSSDPTLSLPVGITYNAFSSMNNKQWVVILFKIITQKRKQKLRKKTCIRVDSSRYKGGCAWWDCRGNII